MSLLVHAWTCGVAFWETWVRNVLDMQHVHTRTFGAIKRELVYCSSVGLAMSSSCHSKVFEVISQCDETVHTTA